MNGDKSGTQRDRKREEEEDDETNRYVSFCSARSEVNPFLVLPSAFLGGGGGGGVCAFFSPGF